MVNGEFKCLGWVSLHTGYLWQTKTFKIFTSNSSSQHLKSKFSQGYILTVKVGRKGQSSSSPDHASSSHGPTATGNEMLVYDPSQLEAIKEFIRTKFPLSVLKYVPVSLNFFYSYFKIDPLLLVYREEYQGLLTYHIAMVDLKWFELFGILEECKSNSSLNIEDYSIGQTSLEQVFLSFTKYQREDNLVK